MSNLTISLPETLRAFVEAQAQSEQATVDDYVGGLIHAALEQQKKRAQIAQYLDLCEQQIARGEAKEWSLQEAIAEGEKRYQQLHIKKQN